MKKIYILCFLSIFCFAETVDLKKIEEKAINGDLSAQIYCSNYYGMLDNSLNKEKGLKYLEMASKQDKESKFNLATFYIMKGYEEPEKKEYKKNGCSLLKELYYNGYNLNGSNLKEMCKDYIE